MLGKKIGMLGRKNLILDMGKIKEQGSMTCSGSKIWGPSWTTETDSYLDINTCLWNM